MKLQKINLLQKSKPQYKNLLKSGILSSEAISNINSKVLRTVRTLNLN